MKVTSAKPIKTFTTRNIKTMLFSSWRTSRISKRTTIFYLLCIVFLGTPFVSAVTVEVFKKLRKYHVVPDVINLPPTSVMTVRYPNHVIVQIGDLLKVDQVVAKPFIFWPAKRNGLYTLIMTDADYPTPLARNRSEFLHWMVININGTQFRVPNGDVKVEYLPPIVNSTAGYHRYVFTAFRQIGREMIDDFPNLSTLHLAERADFNTLAFVKKHQYGYPLAVNFYQVEFK
ncbi:unnamed protein product [Bemisia tabaci]|uniref:Phosphatidylethanolamine-binding protein n=1 Tax=Bemisia tabaci TaxID=7038 RepID=A0A9P0A8Q5_BEMTA|nr:unnamed protein product [Bemisia tabaci]